MNVLDGKVALITGGNAGIGAATARLFAREGARVIIAARRREQGEAVVAEITAEGGEARFVQADVVQAEDHLRIVAAAIDTWGRLDIAFNNAGISHPGMPLAEFDRNVWDNVLAVNLTGVMLAMQAQIPAIASSGGGSIINNSSVAGLKAAPFGGAYCASKHGLIGLSRTAALECAALGIRVNTICPGGTETEMFGASPPEFRSHVLAATPLARYADIDEQASVALFLASDASSYMTGAVLPVDGGLTIT